MRKHLVSELEPGPRADQCKQLPQIATSLHLREPSHQCIPDQALIVCATERLRIPFTVGVDGRCVQFHIQQDVGLQEGRVAVADQRKEEEREKGHPHQHRAQTCQAEIAFAPISPGNTTGHPFFHTLRVATHIAPGNAGPRAAQ